MIIKTGNYLKLPNIWHDVCAAIKALNGDYSHYGPNLIEHLGNLSKQFKYNPAKSLEENVRDFVKHQYERLITIIPDKQRSLKGLCNVQLLFLAVLLRILPMVEVTLLKYCSQTI